MTIASQIISLFLMTSCTLKNFKKDDMFLFDKSKYYLKKLTVSKKVDTNIQKKEHSIPHTDQNFKKKS